MNQLEKAITLDTEDWVLELPEPAPPFNFSRNYLNFRTKLFDKMRGEKYHRLTKRATIAIIIAAILFFISVVALAATVGKTFFLRHYSDHAILEVENTQEASYIYDFNVGYVPAGTYPTLKS